MDQGVRIVDWSEYNDEVMGSGDEETAFSCRFSSLRVYSNWLVSAFCWNSASEKLLKQFLKQKPSDSDIRDPTHRSNGDASGQYIGLWDDFLLQRSGPKCSVINA